MSKFDFWTRWIGRAFAAFGLSILLAACGGGSGGGTSLYGGSGSSGSTGGTTVNGYTLTVSISSTAVTAAAPGTVKAVLSSSNGSSVSGVLVTFTTSKGLGVFSAATALTDSTGTATVTVAPASATSNGADYAIASASVGSGTTAATVTGQIGFTTTASAQPASSFTLTLSTQTITAAAPATLSATLTSASGTPLAGQVVSFTTAAGLGKFSATTALTNSSGVATTTMSPSNSASAGADTVTASVTASGSTLTASAGFQVTATNVTISSFTDSLGTGTLSAYGQTNLSLALAGTVSTSPVNVSVNSQCLALGKATLTPTSLSTTTGAASFTYVDKGCGSVQTVDNVTVTAGAATGTLQIPLTTPQAQTLTFVSASQPTLFLSTSNSSPQSSTLIFQLSDQNGNGVPGQTVWLTPSTTVGGLTMNGLSSCNGSNFTATSTQLGCIQLQTNSLGQVSVTMNSGSVPTTVSVQATYALASGGTISSSSNNLSVAIGVPTQERFSLSQKYFNIEAYDIDGTQNTYTIFAADRMGNPVPSGTAFNLVNTMGQVVTQPTTGSSAAISQVSVVSASGGQRPNQWDGRVTTLAYAIGNMAFQDQNGTNAYASNDPYQDLGNPYLDPYFRGSYVPGLQTIPFGGSQACTVPTVGAFYLYDEVNGTAPTGYSSYISPLVPAEPGTCRGAWGQTYVRAAIQTIWSRSGGNPSWGLAPPTQAWGASCPTSTQLITGYQPSAPGVVATASTPLVPNYAAVYSVAGTALYNVGGGSISFLVADDNPVAFNPMANGTTVAVSSAPSGAITASVTAGSSVGNFYSPPTATVSWSFNTGYSSGYLTFTTTSPSGVATSVTISVNASSAPTGYTQFTHANCSQIP